MLISSEASIPKYTAKIPICIRDCKTVDELIEIVSSHVEGKSYSRAYIPPNLDAFTEIIEDWYSSNWQEKICLEISGVSSVFRNNYKAMISLIVALVDAERDVLQEMVEDGVSLDTVFISHAYIALIE